MRPTGVIGWRKACKERGQATLEYALVMAMVGLFVLFVTRYFLETFSEGMGYLSRNLGVRLVTGETFKP